MDLYIECPVCEQHFSTPKGPPEQQVACPGCSRTFQLVSATVVPPPRKNTDANRDIAPRLAVPSSFESSIPDSTGEPNLVEPVATEAQSVTKKPILALQRKHRRRRRLINTLISSAILATIIGILAGLLYKQINQQPVASNGIPGTVLANPDDIEGEPDDGLDSNPSAEQRGGSKQLRDTVVEPEKPISSRDIPEQKLQFLDRQETKQRWNAVQPHLISLKVFDGLGTHDAVGTIVDSRGWILTSYNAVKGATKIEVTAGVSSIDDLQDANPLTDLVRGYVAEQKRDDLVLLSINRRFIIAFSLVQPAPKNDVVQSETLLQCAPLSRDNLYGGTETRIVKRADFNSLDPAAQSFARRSQLNGEALVWLVATGRTPLPGTPLFKIDGALAAISVFTAENQNYFLPVEHVKNLIAAADGNVKPLRQLGGSVSGPIAVSTTSDMYEPSIRANELAESCKAFNWIPQTDEDYRVFQQFAEAYTVIEEYSRDKSASTVLEDKKIVAQKIQLENLIHQRAASFSAEDELLLAKMNRKFASRALQKVNRHVPFYGEVHSVHIVKAQLILRLVGTDYYAKAPFIPTDHPLRMQTKWLFFCQTPATSRRVNYRISESELITADSVEALLNFGKQ